MLKTEQLPHTMTLVLGSQLLVSSIHASRFMPRLYAIFLILIFLPLSSFGQVVDDTLDWQRYFPLEIGNEWQYADAEGGPVSRFKIMGDTVVDDRHYFVGHETFYTASGSPDNFYDSREVFLRYDSSGIVAEFNTPDADTGFVPKEFFRGTESFPLIDLRSPFGDTLDYPDDPSHHIYVAGGYQNSVSVGGTDVPTAAVKEFNAGFWFWSYAADVGFLGGGNLWGPRLVYARISGAEFGRVIVSSETISEPGGQKSRQNLKVYPNPASSSVQVSFIPGGHAQSTLEVFSIAGRLLQSIQITSGRSSEPVVSTIDVSSMSAGVYFLRLTTHEGKSAASPFAISH